MTKFSRREALGTSAVAVGGLMTARGVQGHQAVEQAAPSHGGFLPEAVTDPPPWEALAPLTAGMELAHGWCVAELSPIERGSAILSLEHRSGQLAELRMMRRGKAPVGVAQTRDLELLLVNRARGGKNTDEELARVIRMVAATVADHEAAQSAPSGSIKTLLRAPAHYS